VSRNFIKRSRADAFSLIEVLFIIIVVFVITVFFLTPGPPKGKPKRIKCTNNLKNVGLAAMLYATDNNDLFPGAYSVSNRNDLVTFDAAKYFRALSNELSTPRIIVCPADNRAREAAAFTNLTTANVSYFASLTAPKQSPSTFLVGDRNLQFTNGPAISSGLFSLTTNTANLSWSKELHNEQGNITMADGHVEQLTSSRLKQAVRDQDISTNLLIIP
jgi:prepilin-type processing-associated H-X9-DG protein